MLYEMKRVLVAALLTVWVSVPALAEGLVEGAKEAGHAIGKGAHDAGMTAKEIGKKILDGGAEAGKEIGRAAADAGKEVGRAAADAGKEVGRAAKEGGKAVASGIKGEGS